MQIDTSPSHNYHTPVITLSGNILLCKQFCDCRLRALRRLFPVLIVNSKLKALPESRNRQKYLFGVAMATGRRSSLPDSFPEFPALSRPRISLDSFGADVIKLGCLLFGMLPVGSTEIHCYITWETGIHACQ